MALRRATSMFKKYADMTRVIFCKYKSDGDKYGSVICIAEIPLLEIAELQTLLASGKQLEIPLPDPAGHALGLRAELKGIENLDKYSAEHAAFLKDQMGIPHHATVYLLSVYRNDWSPIARFAANTASQQHRCLAKSLDA